MTTTAMDDIDYKDIKAHVSKVNIGGLATTKDEYVRKHADYLLQVSNVAELLAGAGRLQKELSTLGCFNSVDVLIDSSKDKIPGHFDVLVEVEEKGPIGGGFHSRISNNEGSVDTSVNFPNLFGSGETLVGEYSHGMRNNVESRFLYTSPINYDPKKRFQCSLFRASNDFAWSKYKEIGTGLSIEVSSPYTFALGSEKELKGEHVLGYEGVWRHLIANHDSSFQVREQSCHSLKSSIKYTNVIDRRNHLVLPTKGAYLKTSVELAGLGGDVTFVRANADYQISKKLFKYFTTQLTFSTGFIKPLRKGEKVLINDKFFLGGPLNLRGFTLRGVGPHHEKCALGNDAYWLFGAHLYTPLPFLHKEKSLSSWIQTHSFVNMGNIVSFDHLRSLEERTSEYLLKKCRLSVGTGVVLSFNSAIRLELNYTLPLWKNKNDRVAEGIEFGIGMTFN